MGWEFVDELVFQDVPGRRFSLVSSSLRHIKTLLLYQWGLRIASAVQHRKDLESVGIIDVDFSRPSKSLLPSERGLLGQLSVEGTSHGMLGPSLQVLIVVMNVHIARSQWIAGLIVFSIVLPLRESGGITVISLWSVALPVRLGCRVVLCLIRSAFSPMALVSSRRFLTSGLQLLRLLSLLVPVSLSLFGQDCFLLPTRPFSVQKFLQGPLLLRRR